VYRVGGGVSAPSLISRINPVFTEEARAAKLNGSILLSIVVDTDGEARDIRVLKGLGMGLDEKAAEAVAAWRFRPGMKDGVPVNVRAQVEVNFRIADPPPIKQDSMRPAFTTPAIQSGTRILEKREGLEPPCQFSGDFPLRRFL
jgi:TonB family protein